MEGNNFPLSSSHINSQEAPQLELNHPQQQHIIDQNTQNPQQGSHPVWETLPVLKSLFEKGLTFLCHYIFAMFLLIIANYLCKTLTAEMTYNRFMIDDFNFESNLQIPYLNDSLEFLQFNGFLEQADLTIIIGESGIGKSTAFKDYAKKLRKENLPVMFISIIEGKLLAFDSFLLNVRTTDRTKFSKVIRTFSNSATLIIDNIHLAKYKDDTFNTQLFAFLNLYLMQTLGMCIIMIASQNSVAYDIEMCKISNFILSKFLIMFLQFLDIIID